MDPAIVCLGVLLLAAGFIDLRTRRIPNLLVGFGICLGFALSYSALGFYGMGRSLEGAAAALALCLPLFLLRAVGAGDVKLMMVVGAFVGAYDTLVITALAFAASGAIALLGAVAGRRVRALLGNVKAAVFALAVRDVRLASSLAQTSSNRVPFAVAILLGASAWLVYFY